VLPLPLAPKPLFIKRSLMNNSCKSPKSPPEAKLLLWEGALPNPHPF
jgi:hypothetical protein